MPALTSESERRGGRSVNGTGGVRYRIDLVREVRVGDHVDRVVVEGDVGSEAAARGVLLALVGDTVAPPKAVAVKTGTSTDGEAAR